MNEHFNCTHTQEDQSICNKPIQWLVGKNEGDWYIGCPFHTPEGYNIAIEKMLEDPRECLDFLGQLKQKTWFDIDKFQGALKQALRKSRITDTGWVNDIDAYCDLKQVFNESEYNNLMELLPEAQVIFGHPYVTLLWLAKGQPFKNIEQLRSKVLWGE